MSSSATIQKRAGNRLRPCNIATAMLALALIVSSAARAETPQSQASQLSDRAFAMLSAINAGSGKAGPMLAPVASLAGDAQTLSTALGANDHDAASRAMAAIVSDRNQIDALAAKSTDAHKLPQWDELKHQIIALEKAVPPARGSARAAASSVSPTASPVSPTGERLPNPPKILISSRSFKSGIVRVKGYFEGTDLKSAGIYDSDQKIKDVEVGSTPGEQRMNFDFSLQQPSPTESIKVADAYG
ncbi:MAG: hypothetical protein JWM69_1442, partial [Candidatus Binatus sp.]|nr:hypothetical protein [Candidatus Binatus sp.]